MIKLATCKIFQLYWNKESDVCRKFHFNKLQTSQKFEIFLIITKLLQLSRLFILLLFKCLLFISLSSGLWFINTFKRSTGFSQNNRRKRKQANKKMLVCRAAFNLRNRTKWSGVYCQREVSKAISGKSLVIRPAKEQAESNNGTPNKMPAPLNDYNGASRRRQRASWRDARISNITKYKYKGGLTFLQSLVTQFELRIPTKFLAFHVCTLRKKVKFHSPNEPTCKNMLVSPRKYFK